MRILFVNQTYMEWYRGANNFDHPSNGGAWVKEHGDDSADTYNFCPFGTEDGVLPLQLNDGTQLKLEGVLQFNLLASINVSPYGSGLAKSVGSSSITLLPVCECEFPPLNTLPEITSLYPLGGLLEVTLSQPTF